MTREISAQDPVGGTSDPRELYLDLMKKCLTRFVCEEPWKLYQIPAWGGPIKRWLKKRLLDTLRARGIEAVERGKFDREARTMGRDTPMEAETMIGLRRMDNLQECVTTVIREKIPGDLVETGVWRGGACIFMRAILAAYGDTTRIVWCADSFQGLPDPNVADYPFDVVAEWHLRKDLVVSLEEVKQNFARYGLLDEQVRFLKGWFKDTLPTAPVDQLAILRLDGDMYESTMDALVSLYPKLSIGGFVIVDDYGQVEGCSRAITDFRTQHKITDPLQQTDFSEFYWRRSA